MSARSHTRTRRRAKQRAAARRPPARRAQAATPTTTTTSPPSSAPWWPPPARRTRWRRSRRLPNRIRPPACPASVASGGRRSGSAPPRSLVWPPSPRRSAGSTRDGLRPGRRHALRHRRSRRAGPDRSWHGPRCRRPCRCPWGAQHVPQHRCRRRGRPIGAWPRGRVAVGVGAVGRLDDPHPEAVGLGVVVAGGVGGEVLVVHGWLLVVGRCVGRTG